jgi:putative transposase
MPRRPRIIVPNSPQHFIQRGNNRQACFYADEDYQFYLEWLKDYADKTECRIHAYVLMTNWNNRGRATVYYFSLWCLC